MKEEIAKQKMVPGVSSKVASHGSGAAPMTPPPPSGAVFDEFAADKEPEMFIQWV